jgi:hypothetical protein
MPAISQVDQRIKAEFADPATQQVVQSRLSDLQAARRLGLGDFPGPDPLAKGDQEIRSHGRIRCLSGSVFQGIPDIGEFLALQL